MLLHVLVPVFTTRDLGFNGVYTLVSASIGAVVLFGMYRMRRWAVVAYVLLAISTILLGTATFGVTWRGLLMALVLRTAIVGPSLYYWHRLS